MKFPQKEVKVNNLKKRENNFLGNFEKWKFVKANA